MQKGIVLLFIIYNVTCSSIGSLKNKMFNKLNKELNLDKYKCCQTSNELIVTGSASTSVNVDITILKGRIETSNKDKQITIKENLKIINKIYEDIKKFKIPYKNFVTINFIVFPEYLPILPKEVYIYRAINEFELILSDVDNNEPLVEALRNNTLTINSINFSVSDELVEKTKISLIEAAGKNAFEKSIITAKTFNITVKEVKSITISDYFIKTNYLSYKPKSVFNIAQVDVLRSMYGGSAIITMNLLVNYGY